VGAQQRVEAFFSGHVQGVGFRYSALSLAQGFRVTGFVRNLPDGRVHLVAVGDRDETEAFLAAVKRHMASHIRESQESTQAATGKFARFNIAR
jgi:acylphosphatase